MSDEIKLDLSKPLVIMVKGKKYFISEQIGLQQWYCILDVMENSGIKLSEDIKYDKDSKSVFANLGILLNKIIKAKLVGKLFSALLTPDGEEWSEEHFNTSYLDMDTIGDKDAILVVSYFLAGRGDLIAYMVDFFQEYLFGKIVSKLKLNLSKIDEELSTRMSDTNSPT